MLVDLAGLKEQWVSYDTLVNLENRTLASLRMTLTLWLAFLESQMCPTTFWWLSFLLDFDEALI